MEKNTVRIRLELNKAIGIEQLWGILSDIADCPFSKNMRNGTLMGISGIDFDISVHGLNQRAFRKGQTHDTLLISHEMVDAKMRKTANNPEIAKITFASELIQGLQASGISVTAEIVLELDGLIKGKSLLDMIDNVANTPTYMALDSGGFCCSTELNGQSFTLMPEPNREAVYADTNYANIGILTEGESPEVIRMFFSRLYEELKIHFGS